MQYSELLEAIKSSTNKYGYAKDEERNFRFGIGRENHDTTSGEIVEAGGGVVDTCEEMEKDCDAFDGISRYIGV